MTDQPDRLKKLMAMLDRQPGDPFTLYAVALEHKKSNQLDAALDYLNRVVQFDPDYCYAYFQKGQVLEEQGDVEAAKDTYRAGIAAAKRKGDAHAQSELEGQLQMIE